MLEAICRSVPGLGFNDAMRRTCGERGVVEAMWERSGHEVARVRFSPGPAGSWAYPTAILLAADSGGTGAGAATAARTLTRAEVGAPVRVISDATELERACRAVAGVGFNSAMRTTAGQPGVVVELVERAGRPCCRIRMVGTGQGSWTYPLTALVAREMSGPVNT